MLEIVVFYIDYVFREEVSLRGVGVVWYRDFESDRFVVSVYFWLGVWRGFLYINLCIRVVGWVEGFFRYWGLWRI